MSVESAAIAGLAGREGGLSGAETEGGADES